MTGTQRLSAALTSLDTALMKLLDGVQPVAPVEVPLADAIGCIVAQIRPLRTSLPAFNVAVRDGWAMRARDLAGASSYAPLLLAVAPVWVEAGDRLPEDCDCVLDLDSLERSGPLYEVVAEAVPGDGVRRAGDDVWTDRAVIAIGQRVAAASLAVLRETGLDVVPVRRPRVRLIGVPARDGRNTSAEFIAALSRAAGTHVTTIQASARDGASIASAVGEEPCDLLLLVGGSGVGRSDAAVEALAARGEILAHGLAISPGRTTAVGTLGATPAIVIPGAPAQALAAWLALAQPVLDRLTLRAPRQSIVRPLARKISSAVGFAELALLKTTDGNWMPLAAGDLPLQHIASADAWLMVPAASEGFAAGAPVSALPLRELA